MLQCYSLISSHLAFSHRVQSLFYTSVSLLLSHIQGYHYHLSKFHIHVLIHYIGVSVSDLLHFAQCKKFDHILEVICSKLMFFPLLSKCITKQVTYLIITIIEVIEDLILLLVVSAVSHLQCLIFLCILSFC